MCTVTNKNSLGFQSLSDEKINLAVFCPPFLLNPHNSNLHQIWRYEDIQNGKVQRNLDCWCLLECQL